MKEVSYWRNQLCHMRHFSFPVASCFHLSIRLSFIPILPQGHTVDARARLNLSSSVLGSVPVLSTTRPLIYRPLLESFLPVPPLQPCCTSHLTFILRLLLICHRARFHLRSHCFWSSRSPRCSYGCLSRCPFTRCHRISANIPVTGSSLAALYCCCLKLQ